MSLSHSLTSTRSICRGPLGRRDFFRIGLGGFLGNLTLPELFRMRAAAAGSTPSRTAVILVWLRGGASHLETYDPKPLASSEFRGPYNPIKTRVPGLQICELLPRHAAIADKFTILRSMAHTGGGHPSGSLQLLTGDGDVQDKQKPAFPDLFSVANYLRANVNRGLPNFVGINGVWSYDGFQIAGSAYLGPSYDPFMVTGDPNDPRFEVPGVGLKSPERLHQLGERIGLRKSFDGLLRELDQSGTAQAMDAFEAQALNILTSPEARRAFDIHQEDPRLRDRYGRNRWGQQCLLARRLVEAGAELVTTTLDGPLCGRVGVWDDHAVNQHVFDALKYRTTFFDQAVTALIEDVYQRGLDKRVLIIVAGEFGRTPRITYQASTGGGIASAAEGTVQPGRDHWPNANSMLFAGGGLATGQVIGGTDRRGEEVVERRVGVGDFLATVYHHLGIDYQQIAIKDHSGRPIPIVKEGKPIPELMGAV